MKTAQFDERARRAGLSTETMAGFEGDQGDQTLIDRIVKERGFKPDTADQAKLAAVFAEVLHEWLTPAQMREVVARNEHYGNACASHDFCDANMAMDEAFTKTQGRELEMGEGTRQSRADVALWNGAWAIAKRMNFDMVLLNAYAQTSF